MRLNRPSRPRTNRKRGANMRATDITLNTPVPSANSKIKGSDTLII